MTKIYVAAIRSQSGRLTPKQNTTTLHRGRRTGYARHRQHPTEPTMDTQRPHNNNSTVSIPTPIHQLLAHTIKGLTMDAIEKANSGHPGMPMGMADTAAILWLDYLRHDPTDCDWPDRDRFVLSAGHGSMLLYSLLHLTGYSQVTLSELKQFRSLHSLTAGHLCRSGAGWAITR